LKELVDLTSFRKEVAASVNDVFERTVGANCRDVILSHFLEESRLSCVGDIAEHPEEFEKFMRELFGEGADVMLNRIMAEICRRLPVGDDVVCGRSFAEFLSYVRKFYVV